MTSLARNALYASIGLVNIRWLQRHSPLPFLCPYHHLVCDEPVPYIDPLYKFKNTRQFEKDLDYLLRYFKPVSLPDVIRHSPPPPRSFHPSTPVLPPRSFQPSTPVLPPQSFPPPRPQSFLLCFDDGLRQAYEIALPILLAKGIPAALFINPSFIDNKTIFHNFKKGWLLHRLSLAAPTHATIDEACRLLRTHSPANDNPLITHSLTPDNPLITHSPTTNNPPIPRSPSIDHLRTAISQIDYNTRSVLDPLADLLDIRWDEFARDHRPAMTPPQLHDWIAKGMAVGAHSMDHPLYSRIPLAEQLTQTLDSMDWVSQNLHVPYRAFAFPHVDTGVGDAFFRQLFAASHPPDLVLGNSTGMQEAHPHVLHRYIGEDPARSAATMSKAVLAYSTVRKLIGRPFVRRD